jgi:hypothetical protein
MKAKNWHIYADAHRPVPAERNGARARHADNRTQMPNRHPSSRPTPQFLIPLPFPIPFRPASIPARVDTGASRQVPERHPLQGETPRVHGPYSFTLPFSSRGFSMTFSKGKLVKDAPGDGRTDASQQTQNPLPDIAEAVPIRQGKSPSALTQHLQKADKDTEAFTQEALLALRTSDQYQQYETLRAAGRQLAGMKDPLQKQDLLLLLFAARENLPVDLQRCVDRLAQRHSTALAARPITNTSPELIQTLSPRAKEDVIWALVEANAGLPAEQRKNVKASAPRFLMRLAEHLPARTPGQQMALLDFAGDLLEQQQDENKKHTLVAKLLASGEKVGRPEVRRKIAELAHTQAGLMDVGGPPPAHGTSSSPLPWPASATEQAAPIGPIRRAFEQKDQAALRQIITGLKQHRDLYHHKLYVEKKQPDTNTPGDARYVREFIDMKNHLDPKLNLHHFDSVADLAKFINDNAGQSYRIRAVVRMGDPEAVRHHATFDIKGKDGKTSAICFDSPMLIGQPMVVRNAMTTAAQATKGIDATWSYIATKAQKTNHGCVMFSLAIAEALAGNEDLLNRLHDFQFAKQLLESGMKLGANPNTEEVFYEQGVKNGADNILSVIGSGTQLAPWQIYLNATTANTVDEMLGAQECEEEAIDMLAAGYERHRTTQSPDGKFEIEYSNSIEHTRLNVIEETMEYAERLLRQLQAGDQHIAEQGAS